MTLLYAILGILSAGPMTGYQLVKHFSSSAGWVWETSHPQIYEALKRLERMGWVRGRREAHGGRLRTVYTLTPAGLEALLNWIAAPVQFERFRDRSLVQALFLDMCSDEAARQFFERYRDYYRVRQQQWAERARLVRERLHPVLRQRLLSRDPSEHDRIVTLKVHVFEGLARRAALEVQWAEKGLALLDKLRSASPTGPERSKRALEPE
jgi:PadR family transcriptional regulator AphA